MNFIRSNKSFNGMMMDFGKGTAIVKEVCGKLHKKRLLAKNSKEISIEINENENLLRFFTSKLHWKNGGFSNKFLLIERKKR